MAVAKGEKASSVPARSRTKQKPLPQRRVFDRPLILFFATLDHKPKIPVGCQAFVNLLLLRKRYIEQPILWELTFADFFEANVSPAVS